MSTELEQILKRRIEQTGPLSVAQYMAEALGHPEHGYYQVRDPLGVDGDFTTAPEISQMFGEIVGLWCAILWQGLGSPASVNWVELGPGRGTLTADALRAAKVMGPFADALRVHLVETSPVLKEKQAETLEDVNVTWHDDLFTVPDGPSLFVANEFFDALPIRQFARLPEGWCETLVGLDPEGDGLKFVQGMPAMAAPLVPEGLQDVEPGSLVEVRPAGESIAHEIGRRVRTHGGAALIIDYGHPRSAPGDTLQAVRDHKFAPVLRDPGSADITSHVDFEALAQAAAEAGAGVWGPVPQGTFLGRLGIRKRTGVLLDGASPEQREEIGAAFRRLTEEEEMGTLFKVLAITPSMPGPPPAFE